MITLRQRETDTTYRINGITDNVISASQTISLCGKPLDPLEMLRNPLSNNILV
jgi:hypothetical protein